MSALENDQLKNYQPVNGVNIISNVIKRSVDKQLKWHLAAKNLDNTNQYAYKTGHRNITHHNKE